MNIFTYLRLSALLLCSFFFTPSYSQVEKDYFITVWDLSLDAAKNSSIEFDSFTGGDVNYIWETIPAGKSGSGKFNASFTLVNIDNLPSNAKIKLKIAPVNLMRFYFFTNYAIPKLIEVNQWGTVAWQSMRDGFKFCENLNITATDLPNLTDVKSMSSMFYNCKKLNGPTNINQWNIQNVTDMSELFSGATLFNQPIGNWDTRNVTDMSSVFLNAASFNQPIGNWQTVKVKDMSYMFARATSFNQPLANWNTQTVTNMYGLFSSARTFNSPIGNWNTQNVTLMGGMFDGAKSFNQAIGNWNTQNVTDMNSMFTDAILFNQSIATWNTGNVTNMREMFSGASAFNQPLATWNTQNVTTMREMFVRASSFNQPIGNWDMKNVTNLSSMFFEAKSFNQPLKSWDTQNVTEMGYMFSKATSFNQPIGSWVTNNVIYMNGMFSGASSFNQPIGNFNTKLVTDMSYMFFEATSFNQRLDSLEINASVTLNNIIYNTAIDCKNYSNTLIGWANNSITPTNKAFGAAGVKYSSLAQAARDILTKPVAQGGKGWTITGDELAATDCGLVASEASIEQSNLSLYPNPAQDKLFLKNAVTGSSYKIIDGLGKEVGAGTFQNEEISVATLPAGLYTLLCGTSRFTFVKE